MGDTGAQPLNLREGCAVTFRFVQWPSPKAAGALTCDEVENRAGEQFTHPIDGEPKTYSMIPTCSSAA